MTRLKTHRKTRWLSQWRDIGRVPPDKEQAYRPHVESLEARTLRSVYSVGPGQAYADLWQVPWDQLVPRDQVYVYWQPSAYHSKIDINTSGISIIGVRGPDGERPVLDANGAQENPSASYFTDEIATEGLITVAPAWSGVVRNVLIQGLDLENANPDSYFFDANGDVQSYSSAAAGVAMYMAQDVAIKDCAIHDNANGIFGKSFGWPGGDLVDVRVLGNDIWGNGLVGDSHEHNTYIEGWYTLYVGNHYGPLRDGAGGVGLKDRSLAPVVAFNYFEGGSYLLDLVDPDDGASDMVGQPDFGSEWVYGNVFVNPDGNAASCLVHFGFDQVYQDAQQTLYFYDNTMVNYNSYVTGRYYTSAIKIDGGGTAYVFDNVLASTSLDGSWSGQFYLIAANYGTPTVYVGANVAPSWMQPGEGVTYGWQNLILADDPGFQDILGGDFRLTPDSPAIGAAEGIYTGDGFTNEIGLPSVDHEYDFTTGSWTDRTVTTDMGVWQSDSQEVTSPQRNATATAADSPVTVAPASPVPVPLVGPFTLPSLNSGNNN